MRLSDLAKSLGMRLEGDDADFTGLNTLEAANATEVSFLANPKYAQLLSSTKAVAVIVDEAHASKVKCALVSQNPYYDFSRAATLFVHQHTTFTGISELAFIHPKAVIGKNCTIHPFAYISEGAKIGDNCVIFPHTFIGLNAQLGDSCVMYPSAVVMASVRIGNRCFLQAGSVIGTDGFGFVRVAGQMQKIPQIGTVILEDGVDIGANSCVDRATLNATRIGKDTKLDNLVQIGHNVSVGEQCLIISQVGIAGSTSIGSRVTLAGQAGLSGHLKIADDVTVGPQSGVAKDIPAGTIGAGSPFMEQSAFLRMALTLPKLPIMNKKIAELEKELALLKEQLAKLVGEEK